MKLAHRLTLKQLRALVAVADSASFTQAARLLHLTQPAISMQIRDAESIVGQVLVDGRREIHLTPAGESWCARRVRRCTAWRWPRSS